ncbi:MAG: cytochrome-c peroxidase [Saprospirales bacterium]|nr:cytochrome-c peroxidase [Saprospirales bacterium]
MRYLYFLLVAASFLSCEKEPGEIPAEPLLVVPLGFPEPSFPEGNELTPERWTLGKRLFFDPVLSSDGTVSCASCHLPAQAFSDTKAFSPGVEGRPGLRNAPTLANVAYHPYYTREGGVPTLEMQVLVPIQEHNEFDFNILLVADRLNQDSTYVRASWEAYGRAPDAFVITRSIACFERTLLSGNAPYDRYASGISHALSDAGRRGMDLFFSEKLACSECHGGFNFTNYAFENNGLYETYADPGRFRLTGLETDRARFKTPTLRNVALTAPYMHDGSLATLDAVIEHYDSGGKAHPQCSPLIKPLGLSPQEKADLLRFLEALTDREFIQNPKFKE